MIGCKARNLRRLSNLRLSIPHNIENWVVENQEFSGPRLARDSGEAPLVEPIVMALLQSPIESHTRCRSVFDGIETRTV